ncbi:VWA domain-containing protein [Streptomyces sp. NPDC001651]|uniref:VWA domain-containing protein n=1 Tax=Streptomyces sp. NPDC001651 TaxID=3364596 RepID=UPI0036981530
MGILTLLRNAFGRSRKAQTAEAEGATPSQEPQPTATPTVPEPRTAEPEPTADDNEHDLVTAAFDNITVPKQTPPAEEPATKPEPETPKAEKPTPEPEQEPEAPKAEEAEAEEPKAEEKPEPVAEATPEPEQVAEVTPEPDPEPEPEPEPVAEVTPEPDPEPEAPKAEEQPEPVTETQPEEPAAAADGEEAPQGPPAADDEGSTGGAGGNNEAEGEAEAEPTTPTGEAEPAADDEGSTGGAGGNNEAEGEAEAEPTTPTGEAEPAADDEGSTGGAGGNKKAEGEAEAEPPVPTNLRTAHAAAGHALTTHNLTGTRAKTYLVLDRSASMRAYYKDGSAQALAEQTLALAAHLDDTDPTVHVVFFSTELDGTGELTLTEHENKIDELHAALGRMGRTSYHVAVEEVVAHHAKTAPDTPALVVFQTDGAPDAKTPANQALTDAAKKHPNVFFSIVAFGDPEQKAFDYLRKLKTGNTATFFAGESPLELTDDQLYDGILSSWRP